MEYDLIEHIQTLLGQGIKGYLVSKPEGTPYPAFVVSDEMSRGLSLYDHNGKPFDYMHHIQINIIGQRYSVLNTFKKRLIDDLDGLSGVIGEHQVVDCRLDESALTKNNNKNFELILMFKISTI